MNKYKFLAFLMVLPGVANAQNAGEEISFYQQYQTELVLGFAILVCLVALLALLVSLYALTSVLNVKALATEEKGTEEEVTEEKAKKVGFWRRLLNKMNDAVPVNQERSILTDHEYDGIYELDNKLPPWWVYMFYATIIFSVGYILHYHVFKTGELQEEEYETEMAEARAEVEAYLALHGEEVDETTVTMLTEENDLITGKELYGINCAPCHGPDGGGTIGPNLTDKYWIHGGSVKDIFATIKYGVPSKGMIPWESQLTPKQMQQLSSYLITLEGTTPTNNKAPEGELYERETPDNQEAREEIVEDAI
ncbi:MAG: cbb3-type cytochrome c oxidase N-terminal domain-containing protein [Candidatus Cyclobacteriaceae bacterium M2_1C_046]